jgi:hypothetical protein
MGLLEERRTQVTVIALASGRANSIAVFEPASNDDRSITGGAGCTGVKAACTGTRREAQPSLWNAVTD